MTGKTRRLYVSDEFYDLFKELKKQERLTDYTTSNLLARKLKADEKKLGKITWIFKM